VLSWRLIGAHVASRLIGIDPAEIMLGADRLLRLPA
jgi:hypothetical protein